jgi:hypothetical protein
MQVCLKGMRPTIKPVGLLDDTVAFKGLGRTTITGEENKHETKFWANAAGSGLVPVFGDR